ncbi:type II toxin-antitoxin system HicB family antitoxin [Candidatus Acetothermia bacterium]|nr:type II toxin-antitoxin system HicB family antitoxin [Candidatus Acetothermia bacterium]
MLTRYIEAAMARARYEILEDGSYYGEIPVCPGVWANEPTLETCRKILREVLEEWLLLKLQDGDPLPSIAGIRLKRKTKATV